MATQQKKRTSGKRKATGKRTTSRSRGAAANNKEDSFLKEVILWVTIAVSLLLFLSNFGIGGTVGNAVSRFFFGVFGLVAYIVPVVLLVGTFFAVSNHGNRAAVIKIIATVLLLIFLCMLIELVAFGRDTHTALDAFYYSYAHKVGGGFLGGLLAHAICPGFGLPGAYIIAIIMLIICTVLITERSAFLSMKRGGQRVMDSARETNERYMANVRQKREEQELRRLNNKVEGVSMDTRILPPPIRKKNTSKVEQKDGADILEIPEIQAEKHVTLTTEGMISEDEITPSIFSKEAEEALNRQGDGMTELFPDSTKSTSGNLQSSDEKELIPETETIHTVSPKQETIHKNPKQSEGSIAEGVNDIAAEINTQQEPVKKYVFPPTSLLAKSQNKMGDSKQHLQSTALKLQQTLKNFGVNVTITNISCGPAVTRYELQPEMGVKVSKIVGLTDDIKLNLAAADIRIEAPIPGKAAIGIEVPNKENVMVSFRELVESSEFKNHPSKISFCVGKDIGGKITVTDIAKMPHLLIAGATGSGKSVCINTIIMSILYKADPKEVKLIMIDPKVVELSVYNGIPHLMIPVVTDPKKAAGALHWAVSEMTDRYQKFADANVRDLKGYNAKINSLPPIEGEEKPQPLPQLVIVVDELADLMMVAPGDVEEAICRLAQLARAAGIHLIIATQRPSVNVITGLIKANMPSRIAFAVTSGIDSRTILDMVGAEKLLGKGDMLFSPQDFSKPLRVQGAFVSDKEVTDVVNYIKEQNGQVTYSAEVEEKMNTIETGNATVSIDSNSGDDGRDAYFADAARLLIDKEKGSIGMLQRYFKVGFNRAARIMDQLEEAGIVGPEEGTKPRRVLMSLEQFEVYEEEYL